MSVDHKLILNSIFILTGETEGNVRQGTCFAISESKIITALHVIESMIKIKVFLTTDDYINGISYSVKVDKVCELYDFAILSIENKVLNNYLSIGIKYCGLNSVVDSWGFPKEKAGKHAAMTTKITNTYESISSTIYSFEIEPIKTINNYMGMSGSPVFLGDFVVGVLLAQQAGTSLYCISFADISKNIEELNSFIKTTPLPDKKVVLFNNYTAKNEPYYYERATDLDFKKFIEVNNVWVFGKSGVGKTAIINRNLITNNIQYCYCDLSPIIIDKADDVFYEVLECLEEKLDVSIPHSDENIIKKISNIICKSKMPKIVIVIDELSVDDENVLAEIAEKMMRLVVYVTRNYRQDSLIFAVSTIYDPKSLLKNSSKASDYFQFLHCDVWRNELDNIFDLICENLNLRIAYKKDEIISSSNGSPRVLKSIIKNIISFDNSEGENIESAIVKAISEVVV